MTWWKAGVLYQIYPRSYYDTNGDGVGDLAGIIKKLDYLEWLGIDGIWLSPFFPSPMADFGYDVSDYCAVDPLFGTLDDFDALVREAHLRGLRIIIDQVYNHTSDQHPWFIESRSSKANPKSEWYIWRDGVPEGGPPNNWCSLFSGKEPESAWQWDEIRHQYYLHLFTPEQPDLNWHHPEVKEAVFEAMKFWLERGVDGFRFDVAMSFFKDPAFRDITLRSHPPHKSAFYAAERFHLDPMVGRPETFLLFEEVRKLLDSYRPERIGMGEIVSEKGLNHYLEFSLPGRLHFTFNYDFIERLDRDPQGIYQLVSQTEHLFDHRSWPCYVLGNHDVSRFLSRVGKATDEDSASVAKLYATLLFTLRGTPLVYYGEEIGMENTPVPYEQIQDPVGKTLWPELEGRDVARTPMQWDTGPQAGFSGHESWLPVHENRCRVNVEDQRNDPASVLNTYRTLIAIRKTSPALAVGEFNFLADGSEGLLGFERVSGSEHKVVLLNFTNTEKTYERELETTVVFGTHRPSGERLGSTIQLFPLEALILDR